MINNKILVFTDLDGTLLDHHTYSWQAAQPALEDLTVAQIPVVICTSKTLPECIQWQAKFKLSGPIIFENGAGIAYPKTMVPPGFTFDTTFEEFVLCSDGQAYDTIRGYLEDLRTNHGFKFQGFGDMSAQDIREHTNLNESTAYLAKTRFYTEPLIWQDSAERKTDFIQALANLGLHTLQGGRFLHITTQANKGSATLKVASTLCELKLCDTPPYLIALGDSPNDTAMLHKANAAVLIRRHDQSWMPYEQSEHNNLVIKTEGLGPVGWHQAITKLMNKE